MIEKFGELVDKRHEYAKAWKEKTGGKVLGWFCTYVPEEILIAANVLPVRILGSHEIQSVTEPHIFAMYCPFCRDCLAQGLKGRFDYLDGIMIGQSCLHLRQTFFSWRLHVPTKYTYYLPMPHGIQTPHAIPYLAGELAEFKKSVENWTGKRITDKDLDRGIEIMNKNRRLMKQIYELRKKENPPLTGVEAMEMVLASQMTDKDEHNRLLEGVLKEVSSRKLNRDPGVRLMITGSEDDDRDFIGKVESLGSTLVMDEQCTGSRYFWNEVIPKEDRLMAIAARYVNRPPCPSKDWPERTRVTHIVNLAKEYNVQGAILAQQKFCDPHELDIPAVKKALEANGVKTYHVEFDVTVPWGQFRTRVEAFLETLRGLEELF